MRQQMNTATKQIKIVDTECNDCETKTQCFIEDEVFENGNDWQSSPRCRECYISDKTQDKFEECAYNSDDEAIKTLIPMIKRLSDDGLLQFLKHVGHRMEF